MPFKSSGSTVTCGDDERDRCLAAARVGCADDGDVGDGRVPDDDRLDLGRGDLERVDLDELLDPIDDDDAAVGVDMAEVAGANPPVGSDHLCRGLRTVQVAEHRLRAASLELAGLAGATAGRRARDRRRAARCWAAACRPCPGRVPPRRRGTLIAPLVSVSPQPWPTAQPGRRRASSSCVAAGRGAPPLASSSRLPRSCPATLG